MNRIFTAILATIVIGYSVPLGVSASSAKAGMMCPLAAAPSAAMSCLNACAPSHKPTLCKLSNPPTAAEKACRTAMAKQDAKSCYLACAAKTPHTMCKQPNSCPMMRSTM